MTGSQTDEQRRHIYLGLTQPILGAVMDHLQTYFQQLYRVTARQPGEEQVASLLLFKFGGRGGGGELLRVRDSRNGII
jgi:hypothetical protein